MSNLVTTSKRNRRGAALTEFGAAFVAFIIFAVLPLLNLGVLPVRYAVAYEILNTLTSRMAVCTKISEADKLSKGQNWRTNLRGFGIGVRETSLTLRIVSKQNTDRSIRIPAPAAVPADWQPDSPNGPFFYYLEQATDVSISPLYALREPWSGIPGLTGPAQVRIVTTAAWENTGRDSDSPNEAFFMNE